MDRPAIMLPSKPTSTRGGNTNDGAQDLSSQNGRSSTGLAAEAAAAALRNFARGRPCNSNRSSLKSSVSSTSSTSFKSVQSGRMGTIPPVDAHSTRDSTTSLQSGSNPTNFAQTLESREDSPDNGPFEDGISSDSNPLNEDQNAEASYRPAPRSNIQGRPGAFNHANSRQRRARNHPPSWTPMLGRDSRYPLPSRRSLFSTPSTPVPRYTQHAEGSSVEALPLDPSGGVVTQVGYTMDPEKKSAWLLDDLIGALGKPDAGTKFPLYIDEKEVDDDMHMPYPDDDVRLKPTLKEFFAPNRLCSIFGLLFMLVGLLSVFILLPVLSYTGTAIYSYPYDGHNNDTNSVGEEWARVNNVKYPLLQNLRTGLIDPDTPKSAMTRQSFGGGELVLVFSDEFNNPNRTFYPGDGEFPSHLLIRGIPADWSLLSSDPFWTVRLPSSDLSKRKANFPKGQDIWYGSTQDLDWYDPDAATTSDGTLTLRLDQFFNHDLNYRSGMINSWNQICFKGGALEISVSLPGPGGASGLWPGAWTLGNLGRPGFRASTDGVWPYTYNSCDAGITPNQSMTDGTSYLLGQKLPSCVCQGEDHPTPGTGRGAPEIDVFEASADPNLHIGVITQSYQVAPYDIWYQPNYDFFAIPNPNFTQMNSYCGGPYQQAIAGQTILNNDWYNGTQYQKYGFEYTPGVGPDSQITWFVGDDISYMINSKALGPNGNVDSRVISEEPMAIVLNLGFSASWTGINYGELVFPTTMYVDYVRLYQPSDSVTVTCDPPGYETTEYIRNHPSAFHNINLTNWDETGYGWPKHNLNGDC